MDGMIGVLRVIVGVYPCRIKPLRAVCSEGLCIGRACGLGGLRGRLRGHYSLERRPILAASIGVEAPGRDGIRRVVSPPHSRRTL
jgi:hypothetical protein